MYILRGVRHVGGFYATVKAYAHEPAAQGFLVRHAMLDLQPILKQSRWSQGVSL